MSDDQIREIITDYNEDVEAAMTRRDARLQEVIDSGRKQADLVRVTGMSREAMRQALNPKVREAVRKARAEKRKQDAT